MTDKNMQELCDEKEHKHSIEYSDRIRDMIKHENELINHRLTWLLVIQGFLFTAVGIALKSNTFDKNTLFITIIAIVGALSCLSAKKALDSAHDAITRLVGSFNGMCKNLNREYCGSPVIGKESDSRKNDILIPGNFFPVLFIVAWVLIGIMVIYKIKC